MRAGYGGDIRLRREIYDFYCAKRQRRPLPLRQKPDASSSIVAD